MTSEVGDRSLIELLTGVLFGAVCIVGSVRRSWALALVISMYAFEQALQASLPLFSRIPSLANFVIALVVGACALREVMRSPEPFLGYFSKTWWCTIILFVGAAASLLWTPAFGSAMELTRWGLPYLVLTILLAPLLCQGLQSLQDTLKAFIILGGAINVLILLNPQFTFKIGRLGTDIDALTRSSPLTIGELGGCVFLAAVLYRPQAGSVLFTFAKLAAGVSGIIVCLLSGSRGQLVFAVLLCIIVFPAAIRVRNIVTFFGSLLVVLFMVAVLAFIAAKVLGFEELRRWDSAQLQSGTSVRVANALDLVGVFVTSPFAWVIGLGFNAFVTVTDSLEPYSHLLFLDILTEQGIPMFIVLCIMLWTVSKDTIWMYTQSREQPIARASIATLGALYLYETLLVNKQGYLWAAMQFFLFGIMLSRVKLWEERLSMFGLSEGAGEVLDSSSPRGESETVSQTTPSA